MKEDLEAINQPAELPAETPRHQAEAAASLDLMRSSLAQFPVREISLEAAPEEKFFALRIALEPGEEVDAEKLIATLTSAEWKKMAGNPAIFVIDNLELGKEELDASDGARSMPYDMEYHQDRDGGMPGGLAEYGAIYHPAVPKGKIPRVAPTQFVSAEDFRTGAVAFLKEWYAQYKPSELSGTALKIHEAIGKLMQGDAPLSEQIRRWITLGRPSLDRKDMDQIDNLILGYIELSPEFIAGTRPDIRPLIDRLNQQLQDSAYVHRYQGGELVFWDNAIVYHSRKGVDLRPDQVEKEMPVLLPGFSQLQPKVPFT